MRSGDTKDKLINIAVERFLALGLEGVSLRDVAKRAGITPMAVYRHYADKEALLVAVVERGFAIYAAYLAAPEAPDEPVNRLRWLAGRVFDFAQEQGSFFELMFLTGRTVAGLKDRSHIRRIHAPTFRVAREALRNSGYQAQRGRGTLNEATTDMLAHCIGSCAFFISGAIPAGEDLGRAQFLEGFDRLLARLLAPHSLPVDTGQSARQSAQP